MAFQLDERALQKMHAARNQERLEAAVRMATYSDPNLQTEADKWNLVATDFETRAAFIEALVRLRYPDLHVQYTDGADLEQKPLPPVAGRDKPFLDQYRTDNEPRTQTFDLRPERDNSLYEYMGGAPKLASPMPKGKDHIEPFINLDQPTPLGGVAAREVLIGSAPHLDSTFWVAFNDGPVKAPVPMPVHSIQTLYGYRPEPGQLARVVVVNLPPDLFEERYVRDFVDAVDRAALSGEPEEVLEQVRLFRAAQGWEAPELLSDADQNTQPVIDEPTQQMAHLTPDTEAGQDPLVLDEDANDKANMRFREMGGKVDQGTPAERYGEQNYENLNYGNQGNQS